MLRSVVRRPSPATIIALLVLAIVAAPLADAAQKAISSPKAQSAAEKKKSTKVEKAKYADNAGKIRGYSVGFAALPHRVVLTDDKGQLPAAVIPPGTTQGPQGPQGMPGPQGARGSGFTVVRLVPAEGPPGLDGVGEATAMCAPDEKVTGGGHEILVPLRAGAATAGDHSVVEIAHSQPIVSGGSSGWYVQGVRIPSEVTFTSDGVAHQNSTPPTAEKLVKVKAWAVCAK